EAAFDGTGKTVERFLLLALPGEGAGEVIVRVRVLRRQADRLATLLLCRVNVLLLEQSVDLDLQPRVDGLHLRLTEHAGRRWLLRDYRPAHQQHTKDSYPRSVAHETLAPTGPVAERHRAGRFPRLSAKG